MGGLAPKGIARGIKGPGGSGDFGGPQAKAIHNPHGVPEMIKLRMAKIASKIAPIKSLRLNHELLRPAHKRAARPITIRPSTVKPKAFQWPKCSTSLTGGMLPNASHWSNWAAPRKLPKANIGKITIFRS